MDGLRLILIFIAAVDVLAFILIFWILDINTYLFPIIKVLIRVSIIFLTYYFFVRVVKKLLNLDDKKKTVDSYYLQDFIDRYEFTDEELQAIDKIFEE